MLADEAMDKIAERAMQYMVDECIHRAEQQWCNESNDVQDKMSKLYWIDKRAREILQKDVMKRRG